MNYDRLWERLLDALNEWTSAREVEPGLIEVSLPDTGVGERQIQIVMTPDEWDDMASVAFGGFDDAFDHVRARLASMEAAETFAVYSTYDLVSSTTPELPVDPDDLRLDELARQPRTASVAGSRLKDEVEPPSG